MAKAYRGVLKARVNKLYGGDVTCSKVKKLKADVKLLVEISSLLTGL
jgi:hypothetical protein